MIEIYYVDEDAASSGSVCVSLRQQECVVVVFETIFAAKRALRSHIPDLVLIDWNLPDGEGCDLCAWIRAGLEELPVILLTVRGEAGDIVAGFQKGADDYVVKPFELTVLYSRILALLRRTGRSRESKLTCGDLMLDREKLTVYLGRKEIKLSQPEYRLLLLLMENKGRTVTREQLLEQIWDSSGNYVNDNTLTVAMKRLREKLHQPSCLKTIRSFGYRMEDTL